MDRVRSELPPFTNQVETAKPASQTLAQWLDVAPPYLDECGFKLKAQGIGGMTFVRKYRPWWVIVLTILTFPIGLLWLLITREQTITVSFLPREDGGTIVTAAGEGQKAVREWFMTMGHDEP